MNVKGTAIAARVAWVRERHPDAWEPFLAALAPATRDVAAAPVLKSAWYPLAAFLDLNLAADRLLGKGDLALVREIGRYAASANMPTVYRLFYRLGSPEYVLKKAAALWQAHYDAGRAELREGGPGRAELVVTGVQTPHPALCRSVEGFMERAIELTGAKDVKVAESGCLAAGGAACVFVAAWR